MLACRVRAAGCSGKLSSSASTPDQGLVEGIEWLVKAIQKTHSSLHARVKKDHVRYMCQRAALRRERQELGAPQVTPEQESASTTSLQRSAGQVNVVWPFNKITGGHNGAADTDPHPLGEAFNWQVGMLSFGSLLGTGTYFKKDQNSVDTGTRGSGPSHF